MPGFCLLANVRDYLLIAQQYQGSEISIPEDPEFDIKTVVPHRLWDAMRRTLMQPKPYGWQTPFPQILGLEVEYPTLDEKFNFIILCDCEESPLLCGIRPLQDFPPKLRRLLDKVNIVNSILWQEFGDMSRPRRGRSLESAFVPQTRRRQSQRFGSWPDITSTYSGFLLSQRVPSAQCQDTLEVVACDAAVASIALTVNYALRCYSTASLNQNSLIIFQVIHAGTKVGVAAAEQRRRLEKHVRPGDKGSLSTKEELIAHRVASAAAISTA
ncbi:hypothetical protein B0T14DRAFT_497514 [Immersiella caudata]|uniref:Uncharacterized protein n=1 Tax=Immersiella caudata TaxID=314043 RepID=A0AA40BWJ0_9PEZI|nr:hypothetical protein B0T14DRAFT_497514 [Immersiella caudata]